MSYKILFAGTPDVAASVLARLIDSEHNILLALTQKDRPKGRGQKMTQSPVKLLAEQRDIPVLQPDTLKDRLVEEMLAQLAPDFLIVVAYGMILPENVLNIPRYGCLNVHYSLLPRWRGAAPIQRAIEAGDTTTGVTIMQMDKGLDTGDILTTAAISITPEDTSASLYQKLDILAPETLLETLAQFKNETIHPKVQDAVAATYAKKLHKSEANIDWQDTADSILHKIHAFNPWPIAQSMLDDQVIRLWDGTLGDSKSHGAPGEIISATKEGLCVATGLGELILTKLQFPGKAVVAVADLLNAYGSLLQKGEYFCGSDFI